MTDIAPGGAVAPAASTSVPVETNQAPQTSPLGSQTPVAEKPAQPPAQEQKPEPKPEAKKEAPSKNAGESLRKALADVKAKAADKEASKGAEPAKSEAATKAPEKSAQPRSEGGQYASTQPKEQATQEPAGEPQEQSQASPHREAPARFSNDAKAAWETAPEAIKAETHRAIRELEQGHQKYRADAEEYGKLRDFADLAKQHGTDIRTALTRYTNMERLLATDPIRGLQEIAQNMRLPLREIAEAIVGQSPDQVRSQQDQTIRQLQAQVQQLTQQVGGINSSFEQDKRGQITSQVEAFAKDHPRLEELAEDIEFFLSSKRASDLAEAYELAERLNPAPASAASADPAPPAFSPAPPLNPAGLKSISGAPSSGSDPVSTRKPSSSTREALKRAFAKAG